MSETIFLAQNANGACLELRGTPAPKYAGGFWLGERLDINDYPPPGECWEMTVTRKGEPSDQQATIERLTKERDELRVTIDLDRANWDRVQDANYRTIAELQARLAKPEMPECVRELLEWAKSEDLNEPAKQIAAVEAHYAPPFKVDKPGWYLASDGKEWRVAEIDGDTAWGRNGFVWYGFSTKRVASSLLQLTKFLRPLEG